MSKEMMQAPAMKIDIHNLNQPQVDKSTAKVNAYGEKAGEKFSPKAKAQGARVMEYWNEAQFWGGLGIGTLIAVTGGLAAGATVAGLGAASRYIEKPIWEKVREKNAAEAGMEPKGRVTLFKKQKYPVNASSKRALAHAA